MVRHDCLRRRLARFFPITRTLSAGTIIALTAGAAVPASAQVCESDWSQRVVAGPDQRSSAPAAYDPVRQRVVLFGGGTPLGLPSRHLGDTWEWDGTSWSLSATTGPSARSDALMVYDTRRHRAVLHGGWNGPMGSPQTQLLVDTWEWDGASWTQRSTSGGGIGYCMVYDPDHARVVLIDFNGAIRFWNGATWTDGNILPAGARRRGGSLAYDRTRRQMVLAGGTVNNLPALSTWEWDGGAGPWVQRAAAGGPPNGQLAYDERRGRVLAYVGESAQILEWDSDTAVWVDLGVGPGPSVRGAVAVAFDPVERQLLVFGGRTLAPVGYAADTWTWELDGAPFILESPADARADSGGTVVLTVVADGPGPLSYRWQRNGVNLTDGGSISGATTPTLTISPATLASGGLYRATVANSCASATSAAALVAACRADWDGNAIINPADVAGFVASWFTGLTTQSLAGDFDDDGQVNPADIATFIAAWFSAATNGC